MFKKTIFAAAVLGATFAASSVAASELKPYIFGNIGMASPDFGEVEDAYAGMASQVRDFGGSASYSVDEREFAFTLGAGLQVHRNFALELGYYDLGDYDADFTGRFDDGLFVDEFSIRDRAKFRGFGLQGVALIPVTENFSGTLSAGLSRIKTTVEGTDTFRVLDSNSGDVLFSDSESFSESSTDTVRTFGVGARYAIMPELELRADYMYFSKVGDRNTTGETNIDMLTVGLAYRF